MTTRSDIEEMIARIALRDRDAFSRLYSATSAKLFGICLRVLNNRAEAEEALQDVYIRIWHKADAYRAGGYSPMTWLITLARNIAIDKLRARKAPAEDIDEARDIAAAGPTPEGADVCVLSVYPKDGEFLQYLTAFAPWQTAPAWTGAASPRPTSSTT